MSDKTPMEGIGRVVFKQLIRKLEEYKFSL